MFCFCSYVSIYILYMGDVTTKPPFGQFFLLFFVLSKGYIISVLNKVYMTSIS